MRGDAIADERLAPERNELELPEPPLVWAMNQAGWDMVAPRFCRDGGTALPDYGLLTPTEEMLGPLDDVRGVRVLEIGYARALSGQHNLSGARPFQSPAHGVDSQAASGYHQGHAATNRPLLAPQAHCLVDRR